MSETSPFTTHQVLNQAPLFAGINIFAADIALQQALQREATACAAQFAQPTEQLMAQCDALAQAIDHAQQQDWARLANHYSPRLHNYDRQGQRIDEVEFHPAWHGLMQLMISHGVHASPWRSEAGSAAHVLRAAQYILLGQLENGAQCPVTMTFASVAALKLAPKLAAHWLPKILSSEYDPASRPIEQKRGAIIGMGMTEKQGGSDVRSNTTRACAMGEPDQFGQRYQIIGHKWFFSAPQADAHLVLAQLEAGLSCFFVPRFLPDGSRNAIVVQRLKDKLGNRSNASSEVEFQGAQGWLLGPPGKGIASIMEMGHHTRLDCVLGSASIMRAALCHALHHARGRKAFGRALAEQPLMQNVLADLALESEAATVFAMRLARCFDQAADPQQAWLARLLTPAGKYWLCKRGPTFGAEAMEVLGGNGYVEDGPLARLYREFPVNSIWEGSGNVMCLDLLRALGRQPEIRSALAHELHLALPQEAASGHNLPSAAPDTVALIAKQQTNASDLHAPYARYISLLLQDLAQPLDEFGARALAERIVLALQAGLLLRHAPPFVAQAFIASRIARPVSANFGCLPAGVDASAILQRALP